MEDKPNIPPETIPIERIDRLLQLSQPKAWLGLLCLLLLLLAFVIWSFVGRIPTEVTGRGILLNAKGVFGVEASSSGTISDLFVNQGDIVHRGQILAKIYNPQRQATLRNIEALKYKMQQVDTQLNLLEGRLKEREKLFNEGLIPKANVDETKLAIINQHISREEASGSIATLQSDLEKNSPEIISPSDGRILELFVNVGDLVDQKQPLVWMEYLPSQGEIPLLYCCVPIQKGHAIAADMQVQVEPITVNPQEYGALRGRVRSVSSFAVSEAELLNDLRNKQLVTYLFQGAPAVTFLSVEPTSDPHTVSGFAWTSGKGPPFPIPTGTLVNLKIVVDEQPPISYLVPMWKLQ